MPTCSNRRQLCRQWFGVICLFIELNLAGGTVFGLPALFPVLPQYGIYDNACTVTLNSTGQSEKNCDGQTRHYQNALTVGIAFYDLTSILIGILIDKFGSRFIKLIGVVFHVIGWLTLALAKPGQDYLLYFHTVLTSLSGIIILLTSYTSCAYFFKTRAIVSALFTGAGASSGMWVSIFQVLIDNQLVTLPTLCYIWMSFGSIMLVTSFLFLDWKFPILNLPYQYHTDSEESVEKTDESLDMAQTDRKWYQNLFQRKGIWKHLLSPLYIMVVMFLSILLLSSTFLHIIWYPWVYYITNQDTSLTNKYTFAFNLSTIASIVICPVGGFLLGFRADRDRKQKLLNISIVQTLSWLINIISCIICMFTISAVIVPALVLSCIARATITAGSQAIVSTFFPSSCVGTLSGMMWTIVGAVTFLQYALIKLTDDVSKLWQAWVIILVSVVLMAGHLVQIWHLYSRERKRQVPKTEEKITRF